MVRAGCRAARDFFCRCGFSRASSADCSWASSALLTSGPPRVLGRPGRVCRAASICCLPGTAAQGRVGGRCQEPFGGPQAVLAYLSRYTHRVAIANRRLISADEAGVTFKWKDYRIEGPDRYKTMTLPTGEFIR